MPHEPKQAVIEIQRIDIDRFDSGRPRGDRVKISNRQIAERISFKAKIRLQVFFAGIPNRDLPDYRQQNWPMKNDQEPHASREANHHTTPDVPVALALRLIVLGHRAILFPLGNGAKSKCPSLRPAGRHSGGQIKGITSRLFRR